MNKSGFKIALRAFLKGKWYNFLSIVGLALGLTAFIFVMLYVDYEMSFDRWNKDINRIFLVELELPNGPSPYTPGLLADEIKSQCPEIEEVGRINTALFKIPFYTSSGRFLIKKWVGADYSIARILGIKTKGFKLDSNSLTPTVLLSKRTASVLFPGKGTVLNKTVNMMSKTGIPMIIAGIAEDTPGNTNFNFDCIAFSGDITSGKDQSYASRIYQTYLLVRPNTDIKLLSKKIDNIYKKAVLADTSQVAKDAITLSGVPAIYLDPLKNLHLKPHYGSLVNSQIVQGLIWLAVIILIVTSINFTNLYIAQANKRSKEVGIKKVNGIIKRKIALQFLLEIFIQCFIALIISFVIVVIGLPYFNQLLRLNLSISGINLSIITQLLLTLIALTLLAGIYPSLVMAGFKPTEVLRGDQFSSEGKLFWVQSSITVLQFTFAITFIISLIVINRQVTFMQAEDPGFQAKEVVYIDNLVLYNSPKRFEPIRNQIRAIPGVKNVTVASNIPGGIIPASYEYIVQSKALSMNTISVDYEYFETLDIELKEGRIFYLSSPEDSINAVINEAAAKLMGIENPVGVSVAGCGGSYKIIGVIKDVKAYGFEEKIKPTIYLMKDHCGLSKTQIMISLEGNAIPGILKTLSTQWSGINKPDGDNFNYHFLDELYGQLFVKQEQLRTVLFFFSGLAVFIATLGLFSSVAYAIRLRMKEVAIRRVFGASALQIVSLLSENFIRLVLLASVISIPIAWWALNKWLENFAYKTDIGWAVFIMSGLCMTVLALIIICFQTMKAALVNPVKNLRRE